VDKKEQTEQRLKLIREIVNLTNGYVDLYSDKSCVDGFFSAEELRTIADKMDELKALEKE
jgi:hypothetical protein